jgi:DNA-binding response OmpR family regulator
MRLLLIEDDAEAAKYLARGLGESGHEVEIAATCRISTA